VNEAAADAVGARASGMEGAAELGFVLGMALDLAKFGGAMCILAPGTVAALPCLHVGAAKLSFEQTRRCVRRGHGPGLVGTLALGRGAMVGFRCCMMRGAVLVTRVRFVVVQNGNHVEQSEEGCGAIRIGRSRRGA